MIVVIPRTWPLSKDGVAESYDSEWLPRCCPACHQLAVIGHGRRSKPAHDDQHTSIRIRRGLCNGCGTTITVLPAWSLPYTHYTLAARAQALKRHLEDQVPLEQSAPATQDGEHVADSATLRRWVQRRIQSWWNCLRHAPFLAPTIFAWDCRAARHILIPEAKPT